jgi:hypothetical protein
MEARSGSPGRLQGHQTGPRLHSGRGPAHFVEGFKDIGKPAPPPEEWGFDWLREPAPRPEWEFNGFDAVEPPPPPEEWEFDWLAAIEQSAFTAQMGDE